MNLIPNGRHLIFLDKSMYTKFYKRYLATYNVFEYQLKLHKDDASSVAGNYYGILAIHNIKTKRMEILLAVETINCSQILDRGGIWRRRDLLMNIFHKRTHRKSQTPDIPFIRINGMHPKLGKIRCASFKGMPAVLK